MALTDLIAFSPKRSIGDIMVHATIEEQHIDELQITEHPVEMGASISDHAYKRPPEVTIRCGHSNGGLSGILSLFVDSPIYEFAGGSVQGTTQVASAYSQLLALQESRIPFDVFTGKRMYQNMLLRSLSVVTDDTSENVLMFTAVCRWVNIVETAVASLPPKEEQAKPASTLADIEGGFKGVLPDPPIDLDVGTEMSFGGGTSWTFLSAW